MACNKFNRQNRKYSFYDKKGLKNDTFNYFMVKKKKSSEELLKKPLIAALTCLQKKTYSRKFWFMCIISLSKATMISRAYLIFSLTTWEPWTWNPPEIQDSPLEKQSLFPFRMWSFFNLINSFNVLWMFRTPQLDMLEKGSTITGGLLGVSHFALLTLT